MPVHPMGLTKTTSNVLGQSSRCHKLRELNPYGRPDSKMCYSSISSTTNIAPLINSVHIAVNFPAV